MKIAIGADHAGYAAKEHLKALARRARPRRRRSRDATASASVDYPDFAAAVGRAVAGGRGAARRAHLRQRDRDVDRGQQDRRASAPRIARTGYQARVARQHNDANVLCLGARVSGLGVHGRRAGVVPRRTAFDGGRHASRVEKIERLDRSAS